MGRRLLTPQEQVGVASVAATAAAMSAVVAVVAAAAAMMMVAANRSDLGFISTSKVRESRGELGMPPSLVVATATTAATAFQSSSSAPPYFQRTFEINGASELRDSETAGLRPGLRRPVDEVEEGESESDADRRLMGRGMCFRTPFSIGFSSNYGKKM